MKLFQFKTTEKIGVIILAALIIYLIFIFHQAIKALTENMTLAIPI